MWRRAALLLSRVAILLAILVDPPRIAFAGFLSFQQESARITRELPCDYTKVTPGDSYFGDLFSCISGDAETVKIFINGIQGAKKIKNIKLMWNDWHKDAGFGIHADIDVARTFVRRLAHLYTPSLGAELDATFLDDRTKTFTSDGYEIEYRFTHGPSIDERLLVISE